MKFEQLTSSDELATLKEQERIEKLEVAEASGLTHVGKDTSGEDIFIGTKKQWEQADTCGYDEHMSYESNYQEKLIEF